MSKKGIEEVKQQLKPGWQGTLYIEPGRLGRRFGKTYNEFNGTVLEKAKWGLIIEKDKGGKVKVPYEKILDFEPIKTPDQMRKELQVGSEGDFYLRKGTISGIVTGIYGKDIVLNQPKTPYISFLLLSLHHFCKKI